MGPIDVYLVRYVYGVNDILKSFTSVVFVDFLFTPFHSSQFEEKFEEINGVDAASNLPTSPEVNRPPATVITEERGKEVEIQGQDGHRASSDFSPSQDFVSGIMKIVPSDIDVSMASVCELYFFMCNGFAKNNS